MEDLIGQIDCKHGILLHIESCAQYQIEVDLYVDMGNLIIIYLYLCLDIGNLHDYLSTSISRHR